LHHKQLVRSDYREAHYYEIIFLKIRVAQIIVTQSVPIFFFDCDLVFFKVPAFPPLDAYDLAVQRGDANLTCELERGKQGGLYADRDPSCDGKAMVNSGQFGVVPSNTNATLRMLEDTLKCGEASIRGEGKSTDQACLSGLLLADLLYVVCVCACSRHTCVSMLAHYNAC